MDSRLNKIYEKNIIHSSFLDKNSIENCIKESYELGTQDVLDWLSKMEHLTDNIDYIIQEFKNQNYVK
jgi:hypothetical protein